MNLQKLFEIQAGLDYHIVKEKGLEGQNLLDEKILALQVELGECANEWRGFKFWSENQEPNHTGYIECDVCTDQPGRYEVYDEEGGILSLQCPKCEGYEEVYVGNRLLEEYVDCLHFILSIGLEIGVKSFKPSKLITFTNDITGQFNAVFKLISGWDKVMLLIDHNLYYVLVNNFLNLGEQLGFTWEQIEQSYLEKNL